MRSCSRLRESQSVFLSLFFRSVLYERLLSIGILLLPVSSTDKKPRKLIVRRKYHHGELPRAICATDIPAGKSTKCIMIDYQTRTRLRWTLRSHYNLSDRHCGCHWIVTFCKLNLSICICQSTRK